MSIAWGSNKATGPCEGHRLLEAALWHLRPTPWQKALVGMSAHEEGQAVAPSC